jgi:hypothetical protein
MSSFSNSLKGSFKFQQLLSIILMHHTDHPTWSVLAETDSNSEPEELRNPYEYIPTRYVCLIFVVLFGVSTCLFSLFCDWLPTHIYSLVIHLVQALWRRRWFMIPTAVLAGLLEVLGWSGRLWSSYNPLLDTPFLIQYVMCSCAFSQAYAYTSES